MCGEVIQSRISGTHTPCVLLAHVSLLPVIWVYASRPFRLQPAHTSNTRTHV